jgi:glucose-6-phosphate isomerase
MMAQALKHYSDRSMTFQFVSNIDGTAFVEAVMDDHLRRWLYFFTTFSGRNMSIAAQRHCFLRLARRPKRSPGTSQ